MFYELHDAIDLDLKSIPVQSIQTTRMVNTKNTRRLNQVQIGKHIVSFLD